MTAITFPTSPTNGQSFTANGINYIWNSARGTWSKQSTTTPSQVTGHIIPDTTLTYDLGSATNKFRDLYMDGDTLHLGDETIKSGADGVEFTKLKVGHGGNTIKFEVDASTGRLKKESTKAGVKQPLVDDVESIGDLSDVDITTSAPTNGQSLVWDNANSKFIPGDAGGGTALVGITSIDSVSAQTIIDEVNIKSYTMSRSPSSGSINEGQSVTFTLTTTWVGSGTNLPYTITGISAADLSAGSLTGNFTVTSTGTQGECSGTVSVTLSEDVLAEGSETLSINLDNGEASSSVTIIDTSKPPPSVIDYEPSWSATHIYGELYVSGNRGNAGDYYRHETSFTFNSAAYLSETNFNNEDQIVWLYFLGGGGGGQSEVNQNGLNNAGVNSWRFGGSGGCAMIWVGRASDFHGAAITIGAGGAVGGNGWRGGHSSNSSITLGGTTYTTNEVYNGARIWNPNSEITQSTIFTGPNFEWPVTGSAYPNGYTATSRGYASYVATGKDNTQSVWGDVDEGNLTGGVNEYITNRTFAAGRGAGSGTANYSGYGFLSTSRYAGDGMMMINNNAGTILTPVNTFDVLYQGGGGGCSKPGMTGPSANPQNAHAGIKGNLRVYWG